MNNQLQINNLIEKELVRCRKLYNRLQKEFERLPRGSIIVKRGIFHRYLRGDNITYSIAIDNDIPLINALKMRRYIKKGLPKLEKHIKACEAYLSKNAIYDPYEIEKSLPFQYKGLEHIGVFLDEDINIEKWKNAKYKKNSMKFHEKHYTTGKVMCRSKSEALIGICLEQRNIPYRYEPEIRINKKRYCPDFEILLPNTRKTVYLEHFGLIDNIEYAKKTIMKIEDYSKSGLILGTNFFFTSETEKEPLNVIIINQKLDEIMKLDQI